MSNQMNPNLSIIVLTYNRSDALAAVLYGLTRQVIKPKEVIISDDGSQPEHKLAIKKHLMENKWPFRIKYIWHPDIGFTASRARNQAATLSSEDYLIFLDGDCIPRPDFIAQHLAIRKKNCFINGSRILLSEKITNEIILRPNIIEYSSFFWLRQRLTGRTNKWLSTVGRIPIALRHATSTFNWKGIRSCNFALWRSDFNQVNGFDESFVGWGHEDADFVWRLHLAGCQRINGYWATEVLHLWHKEASRDRESANAKLLQERIANPDSGFVAAIGLREATYANCEIVYTNE